LEDNLIRIYFSKRDIRNCSLPYFLEYDLERHKINSINEEPVLALGDTGTFDDSGIMPTCLVKHKDELRMYYIGWNLGVTVPFRNSIGIAISNDDGKSFRKLYDGPILDRTKYEPHFVASSCVIYDKGVWKIWYLSCTKWKVVNNQLRHYYHIKYAESNDGIDWERKGIIAIDFKYDNEYAISVPRVIYEEGLYKMWYSYRGGAFSDNYKIGYAESMNGINWNRLDEQINIITSKGNWDNESQCYPFIFDFKSERYMLYNGNGYGKSGFGIAKLQK
jgi:hypothetical protein